MKKLSLFLTLSFVVSASHGALVGRDLDGDNLTAEAYFDTTLGITWLRDANEATATSTLQWQQAMDWAAGLTYAGATWRLANMDRDGDDTIVNVGTADCSLVDCTDNEYGHLYYQSGISTATLTHS